MPVNRACSTASRPPTSPSSLGILLRASVLSKAVTLLSERAPQKKALDSRATASPSCFLERLVLSHGQNSFAKGAAANSSSEQLTRPICPCTLKALPEEVLCV